MFNMFSHYCLRRDANYWGGCKSFWSVIWKENSDLGSLCFWMTKWECFRGSNFQKGLINHSLKEGKKKKTSSLPAVSHSWRVQGGCREGRGVAAPSCCTQSPLWLGGAHLSPVHTSVGCRSGFVTSSSEPPFFLQSQASTPHHLAAWALCSSRLRKLEKKKSSHHRQWQASVSPWYPCNNLVFKAALGFWSREREGKDRSAKEGIQRMAFSRALCPNRKARVWWFLLLRFTARSYFPWQYCPLPLWTAITKHLVSWKATGSGRSFQSAALRGANVLGGKCWGSLR